MTDRELMQMALDALEEAQDYTSCPTYSPSMTQQCATAAVALRARLANEFNPDWDAMAVMVEEQQRMAKRIEELEAALAQPEQEIEPDRPHVEDDGCPTEKAVLQRFWREHQAQPERKLWLWKNFVDDRPEYWAFDNPYPTNLDNGDPQTLGQPCGYAIFKPSRDGSCGRTEEQVLREMKSVIAPPQREWVGLTLDEIFDSTHGFTRIQKDDWVATDTDIAEFAHIIEARLKAKNT